MKDTPTSGISPCLLVGFGRGDVGAGMEWASSADAIVAGDLKGTGETTTRSETRWKSMEKRSALSTLEAYWKGFGPLVLVRSKFG